MKKIFILFSILICANSVIQAQQSKDSVMARLTSLRDDYVGKIKAMGYTPRLALPPIVLDNPRSFGNYDDSLNVVHTCYWPTLEPEGKAVFDNFAKQMGHGMNGEKFFQLAVYQWIFIHELSHWWQACQNYKSDPYETEKGANRIATAYWNDRDLKFYQFMLSVFQGVVDHVPSPVPAGFAKEKYLDDNYQKLPGGNAYTWYQSIMIVEVSKEKPFETFKQAIALAGKPVK
ncbi:hypothetical protein [Mucilaginibacter sp.]